MSQDLIFPLLPRNTKIDLNTDRDRVEQLQKKQKIKGVRPEEGGETQHARVEERNRQQQEQGRKEREQQSEQEASDSSDEDGVKGQNLDTFA
ncbi:MAG: hypothetical protein HLUCCO02_00865 [Idiomarinaceae bacterium HL-53]|nr:MAG: hypothetical protein HLUCCO02_00865 [Idiomarinaceae bacterium HL-53]CUS48585.1 hypothetical protein Ga0003345_1544 [Idiomarinaceae bacterium HL-53]